MTLFEWLRARVQRRRPRATILPPPPFDEATRQLELAIERTEDETRRLAVDGSELSRRIARNARAGRGALEGKPT